MSVPAFPVFWGPVADRSTVTLADGGRVVGGVDTRASVEDIVAHRAGEHVAVRRADHVLVGEQRVRSRAARVLGGEVGEVQRDAGIRGRIVQRVRPGAAVERVVPAKAGERVVAVVPVEDVGAGLAGDRVVPGASRDVGDGHQGVRTAGRRRREARARPAHGAEDDEDVLGERGVVDAVGAEVAVNEVVAGVAVEDVVAGAAGQDVRTRVAAEDVGSAAARQVLELGDLVGAGTAGGLRRRISQRERHASGHAGVVEQVDVASARDRVVSGAFEDHVVSVVAEDEVVAGSACLAIVTEASAQGVVAPGAVEDVVASAAGQVVGASAPGHDVVAGAANSVLDVGADVVRLSGLAVVEDTVERDEDACGARAVGHRVVSAAAGHRVGAVGVGPLVEDVVPEAARERVPAILAGEAVVALAAGDRVVARAAGKDVAPGAARDRVVALAARNRVVAAVAAHREEQRGRAAGDRIARARERVGAVAPRHRAELDVRQRDVDVVVGVEVQPGGAERDDVAGRGAGDGDAVEDARGEVDDELDLRKARALHRYARGELAAAEVDGDVLGARRAVDDDRVGQE